MSPEEKLLFCGLMCAAARKLGMPMKDYGNAFSFFDKKVGIEIRGFAQGDKQECLLSACQQLEKYFAGEISFS